MIDGKAAGAPVFAPDPTSKPKQSSRVRCREDAQQAIGYSARAKRSKSGAISLDLVDALRGHAAV